MASPTPPPPADGIRFEAPQGWIRETPSNPMRKAQYRIPDKEGKAGEAELTVFFFGPDRNLLQANLDRWARQMGSSDPKPETFEGRCRVTLLDLSGTYRSDFAPEPIEKARMLAAVVEASDGPWYFKLVGPADTVGDWRDEFVALLKGAHR
ncbi:MAG TPA: hypothetical protein VNO22_03430 [Planctomycetota bacterium]|jgi:hypothetical protein|nr:hypothetical protein [Planctomycetota bacterium]